MTQSDHCWIPFSEEISFPPPDAVIGGTDAAGRITLIGRTNHGAANLVMQVNLTEKTASTVFDGQEITIQSNYEFLTGRGFEWVKKRKADDIPKFAVSLGATADGQQLYIGRVHHNGSLLVGNVQPSENCMYIPQVGDKISVKAFEVLVQKPQTKWIDITLGEKFEASPVEVGKTNQGLKIYVAQFEYEGHIIPGKVIPDLPYASLCLGGQEFHKKNSNLDNYCKILSGSNFKWVQSRWGMIHANAVIGGRTNNGEVLYIGRAKYEDEMTPGKIQPSKGCLYIPKDLAEHKFTDKYEILVQEQD